MSGSLLAESPERILRFPDDTRAYASLEPLKEAELEPFYVALRAPAKRMGHFSLLVNQLDEPPIWFTNVALKSGKLFGVKGALARLLPGYKLPNTHGTELHELDPSNILDWMYVRNFRLVGGRTIAREVANAS